MIKADGWAKVCNDIVIKQVGTTKLAEIPVVHNEVFGSGENKKEHGSFFTLEVWDTAADYVEKYGKKGQWITFNGILRQERWQDKEGNNRSKVVIRVQNFKLLESPAKAE